MSTLTDVRTQDRMQRELEAKLRETITAAIDSGLDLDWAWAATKSVYDSETLLERSRKEDARSY